MYEREWPRSRYWLAHFLNFRHMRAKIDWSAPGQLPAPLAQPVADWLAWVAQVNEPSRQRMLDWALTDCADDPAYVQSLRLFVKEEQHHTTIINRWLTARKLAGAPCGALRAVMRRAIRPLGLRFELSVLLLGEIVTVTMNRLVRDAVRRAGPCSARGVVPASEIAGSTGPHPSPLPSSGAGEGAAGAPLGTETVMAAAARSDAALAGVLDQLITEHHVHLSFHSERLTAEFADFNFIRRNLRRLRLRGMFAALVAGVARHHRALLAAIGCPRRRFSAECWSLFSTVLERMVPYRRETLMATLLDQREKRFEKPMAMRS